MCIRDRYEIVRRRLFKPFGREQLAARDLVVSRFKEHYTKPVSYTHLRAHETVLDLVCRLLLEKKKPQTQTQTQIIRIVNTNLTILDMRHVTDVTQQNQIFTKKE